MKDILFLLSMVMFKLSLKFMVRSFVHVAPEFKQRVEVFLRLLLFLQVSFFNFSEQAVTICVIYLFVGQLFDVREILKYSGIHDIPFI